MLDTIKEEDVDRLRGVFRLLFLVPGAVMVLIAGYTSERAWTMKGTEWSLGFGLLAGLLWTSCAFLVLFERACARERALEIFQQPCIVRWIYFAATFPMQVVLCAWYVGVTNAHTIVLLIAATLVCALLGFVLEQAWNSEDLEEPITERSDPLSLSVGTAVRGPQADPMLILTQRLKAWVAWAVCMTCVLALHGCVWYVVLDELETSNSGVQSMKKIEQMVHVQCGLLSVLWLVPVLQVLIWWLGQASFEEGLVGGSMAYVVLDIAAKVQLAVAYSLAG
jgi:hypothetical protein